MNKKFIIFTNISKKLCHVHDREIKFWLFDFHLIHQDGNFLKIKIRNFSQKIQILIKNRAFCQKSKFWSKIEIDIKTNLFLRTKILIFDPNFDFAAKFLSTILIFNHNFGVFWSKFLILSTIYIFNQNFDSWSKFRFLTKVLIFDPNFDFWTKFRFFFTKIVEPYFFLFSLFFFLSK